MRDYVISTETNSDLPQEYLATNQIRIIPHYYTIEGKMYGEEEVLSAKEFYQEMRLEKKAQTMASNPGVIQDVFEQCAVEGKDILHISFSSALSGGYNNIMNGARDVMEAHKEMKAVVVDTLTGSLGEGLLIRKAVELKKQGKTLEEVAKWLEENKESVCALFTVDDLNHLYRGGRLSKSSAMIGSVVSIKPILAITSDGRLTPVTKTRGRKKALKLMAEIMHEQTKECGIQQDVIGIIHGDQEEDANYLAGIVKEMMGYESFLIQPIGPSIGVHTGPGAMGLCYMGKK